MMMQMMMEMTIQIIILTLRVFQCRLEFLLLQYVTLLFILKRTVLLQPVLHSVKHQPPHPVELQPCQIQENTRISEKEFPILS